MYVGICIRVTRKMGYDFEGKKWSSHVATFGVRRSVDERGD